MAGNSTAKQTIQRMGRVLRKKKHNSHLYQIYCKETIEEKQSDERGKIFKELCSNYKEKIYYE
jgi:superfamily II DNA or RNA helicase